MCIYIHTYIYIFVNVNIYIRDGHSDLGLEMILKLKL